jgi:hypothetical protein
MWKRDGIARAEIESGMIRQLVMYLFLTMVCTFSEGHNTWRLAMTMRRWFGMCSEVDLSFSHISITSTLVCIFLRSKETLFSCVMFELTIIFGHGRLCKAELKQQDGHISVDKLLAKGFGKWFKTHVRCFSLGFICSMISMCVIDPPLLFVQIGKLHEEKKVSDNLFALACEPDRWVRLYSAYIVDGVWYCTVDRKKNQKTQNSGVISEGDHDGE